MTDTTELDELYIRRGELLDLKYMQSRVLLDRQGYYSSDDFAAIDAQIQEVTEQIESYAVGEWIASEERGKDEAAADVQERADLYAIGMGR